MEPKGGQMMMGPKSTEVISYLTMAATAVLFVMAAIEKGLTHDLSLEAAVFLVSMKLVLASRKSDLSARAIEAKLEVIEAKLDEAQRSDRKSA